MDVKLIMIILYFHLFILYIEQIKLICIFVTFYFKNQVQTPAVPPKQISVVEEDRFSLRPIGPGVQPLEPEGGSQSGTLGRATTPSFPVSPVASAGKDRFISIYMVICLSVYLYIILL